MKKYIKSDDYNSGDDFGYGYDSNGEPIDESTVDELYRIAEREILPESDLAKLGRVTIDEDTFDYYMTRTAWGARIKYTMYLETDENNDVFDLEAYALESAFMRPSFDRNSILSRVYTVSLQFNIYVEGYDVEGYVKVEVELADGLVYKNGVFDSYHSERFAEYFDEDALCDRVKEIAEPAVREIHRTLSDL